MANEIFRYNWFETNLVRFFSKYTLPINYDKEYLDFVRDYKCKFMKDYKDILLNGAIKGYPDFIYDQLQDQYDFVEKIFNNVINIIKTWEAGKFVDAELLVNSLLENLGNDLFTSDIDRKWYNHTFYRVRLGQYGDFDNKPMELFHIPFSKRHLVRNDRYNTAGTPCLYLSSVLNLAWRECGMPTSFYFSEYNANYDYIDGWKFIYLQSPQDFCNDYLVAPIFNDPKAISKSIVRYIKTFPLVFACSVMNRNGSVPYKPEYIIPQLLMHWVKENYSKVKGIIYFPCTLQKSMRKWNGYNIVLPTLSYNNDGYSEELLNAFTLSKPFYQNNMMSEDDRNYINSFYRLLSDSSFTQSKIMDCYIDMYRNTVHALEILNVNSNVESSLLINYIEMLLETLRAFQLKYDIGDIIQNCKNDICYQTRYEKEYENFKDLFGRFLMVCDKIYTYYDYLDRGIVTHK